MHETIAIRRLGLHADSIGNLEDGRIVFIPFGCPGDVANVEIADDSAADARSLRGHIVSLTEKSAARVTPPCPHFTTCGGCDWQHIDYQTQLSAKRDRVVETLVRIGGCDPETLVVRETIGSDAEYGYRNKIELNATFKNGRLELGMMQRGSNDLVPIDACLLLPKKLQKAPKALRGALRFAVGNVDYGIERVAVRVGHHSKDVEIAIYTRPGPFPRAAVAKTLSAAFDGVTSIVRVITKDKSKARKVVSVEVLHGRGHLRDIVSGIDYGVSAPSFWQVNTGVTEKLVAQALTYLDVQPDDYIVDLYAGAGTFTLPISQITGDVAAVEAYGPAVRDLRRNMETNYLDGEIIGGDAARELEDLGPYTGLLVDPPRDGLDKHIIEVLGRAESLKRIVYVSCDPATLARDVKRLREVGFELIEATPVDLFPQTYHVETVALLSRVEL